MNLLKNKKIRNWGIAVLAVIVMFMVGLGFSFTNKANAAVDTEAKVVNLSVAEEIEASGSLQAQPFAALVWKTSGVVEKVNVKAGDQVKAGDILMSLQTTSASSNIISAQSDLVSANKDLDNLMNSSLALAQAEQNLSTATQAVDDAQKDVTKLEYRRASDDLIDQIEDEIILAKRQVSRAEDAYSLVKKRPNGDSYKAEAELNLINARMKRDELIDTLDWYLGTPSELDAAKYRAALSVALAQQTDAQREVDRLKNGATADDIASAQARVDAAQSSVNTLSIIAPFDGEVLSVDGRAGDVVNSGDLTINMADMNHLYVDMQVDESDIAAVKLGNQAKVTLDAVTGVVLAGHVTAINPVGENISGLVKYRVRVDLDKVSADTFVPLATTANVVITVKKASANLAVPITAIQNDSNGEYVWVIQVDGSSTRVDVVSGSIVGDIVVVTGDLKEGDRLQLIDNGGFQAPNPLQGGG